MRFSLRTLIMVMLLGGPALAGVWAIRQRHIEAEWRYRHRFDHCSDNPEQTEAWEREFWRKFCDENPEMREAVEKRYSPLDKQD